METEKETFFYLNQKFVLEKRHGLTVAATVQILPGVPPTKISPGFGEYFKGLYERENTRLML